MIYTTMTKKKVLRLIARGWEPNYVLSVDIRVNYPYYEISLFRAGYPCGIAGFGYRGGE